MSLEGKVALITGGARGLGRAYVLHLARLGADVIIADIDLQAAREYGEELTAETVEAEVVKLGRRGLGVAVDVTDRQAVDALVAEGLDTFGRIYWSTTPVGTCARTRNKPPPWLRKTTTATSWTST